MNILVANQSCSEGCLPSFIFCKDARCAFRLLFVRCCNKTKTKTFLSKSTKTRKCGESGCIQSTGRVGRKNGAYLGEPVEEALEEERDDYEARNDRYYCPCRSVLQRPFSCICRHHLECLVNLRQQSKLRPKASAESSISKTPRERDVPGSTSYQIH